MWLGKIIDRSVPESGSNDSRCSSLVAPSRLRSTVYGQITLNGVTVSPSTSWWIMHVMWIFLRKKKKRHSDSTTCHCPFQSVFIHLLTNHIPPLPSLSFHFLFYFILFIILYWYIFLTSILVHLFYRFWIIGFGIVSSKCFFW